MNDHRRGNSIRAYRCSIILLLIIIALTPSAAAADTMFRANPEHTGVYDNSGVVPKNAELWRFTTKGGVSSSPVVDNGVVYVWSLDYYLYAINAMSGKETWRFYVGYVSSSPAVSNGVVYLGGNDYDLHAIDAVTGSEKWLFETRSWVHSSPAVSNGIVYVGSDDWNLYAIDAVTGKEKWRFKSGGEVRSPPAVVNGVVYVGSNDQNLYAIDAVTGKEKWRFVTGSGVTSSPAVSNGVVYVGSNDKNLYAIDAVAGKEKWRFATGGGVQSSPAVSNGVVYVGSDDKNLYAIDAITGKEKWRFATGDWVQSSPAVSNGVVYVGSHDTNLYAIGGGSLLTSETVMVPFNSGNNLFIIGFILVLIMGGIGGYGVLHSKNPTRETIEDDPESGSDKSRLVKNPIQTSSPESKPSTISNTILDRITTTERKAIALTLFRAPVDNLLDLARQYYNLGKYPDAEHVLKKAETATVTLGRCESQLSQWKNRGYDTTPLETLRTDVADKILSTFREFEKGVEQLEKVQSGLEELKRNYPSIITQEEFQTQVTSLQQKLKKPDLVNITQSEFERLSKNIEHTTRVKDRREQHLRSQVKKIQQDVSDKSLENEINVILKSLRTGDLPAAERLFKELVSRQVLRVNDTITSLLRDGVVIPPSITPLQQKPDNEEYGDQLIETWKRLGELDRLRVQFKEATALKDTVQDTRLLALYDIGEYEQVIAKCKIQEHLTHESIKSQNNRDLIFISSKSEDFNHTKQVYTFLKDRGYNVFFSQQTLPDVGSSDYRKEIDRALDASKHMIVVTSKKEHVEASWVEAEWGLFINEKRSGRKRGNIITLIIGTMRIEDLPSSLRYYEVIPFDLKTFEKILKYLK